MNFAVQCKVKRNIGTFIWLIVSSPPLSVGGGGGWKIFNVSRKGVPALFEFLGGEWVKRGECVFSGGGGEDWGFFN